MSFAPIGSRKDNLNTGGGTSGALDTTGADFLVISVGNYTPGDTINVSDSKGNTGWNKLTVRTGNNVEHCIFWCVPPPEKVGSGHTWTATGSALYLSGVFAAFSGAHASPFHQESGAGSASASTLQAGSLTPPEDGCLVLAGLGFGGSSVSSINSGFTVLQTQDVVPGACQGSSLAYLIQTTAAAANPTWTMGGSTEVAASLVVFKSAAGPTPELTPGTASFVKSGPAGIFVSSTDASDGTPGYTYQWQRNEDGGSYSNLVNGGGVSGATTLNLVDGSAVAGVLYGYRLKFSDAASPADEATSNVVTAQVYTGGPLSGGGHSVFHGGVFA